MLSMLQGTKATILCDSCKRWNVHWCDNYVSNTVKYFILGFKTPIQTLDIKIYHFYSMVNITNYVGFHLKITNTIKRNYHWHMKISYLSKKTR